MVWYCRAETSKDVYLATYVALKTLYVNTSGVPYKHTGYLYRWILACLLTTNCMVAPFFRHFFGQSILLKWAAETCIYGRRTNFTETFVFLHINL